MHVQVVAVIEGQSEVVEQREIEATRQEKQPELDGAGLPVVQKGERPHRQVAVDVGRVVFVVRLRGSTRRFGGFDRFDRFDWFDCFSPGSPFGPSLALESANGHVQ